MRMMNSRESIKAEFISIDQKVDKDMTVYLMGGGAMTFRRLKNSTYDLDLLVTTRQDFELLRSLLLELDYEVVENPIEEYKGLGAAVLLDKDGACRFDIFDRKVIRKLSLTDGMRERSQEVFAGSKLYVQALSNEDIFLFKGVSGRSRDVNDMVQLVETGLAFDVIIEEFKNQLPMNKGKAERDILRDAPENHPVIAFERALESLPMTIPRSFMTQIEQEADRVHAEYEIMNKVAAQTTITEITEYLIPKRTVSINSRADVENILEGLAAKGLIELDDENIRLNKL